MATLRLQINEKVLDKVLWLLGHFAKDEVEIIPEDSNFTKNKKEIERELQRMDAGEATYVSTEELNGQIAQIIAKYED